jgi:RimJ/RimL family protein N-acetyltransferase
MMSNISLKPWQKDDASALAAQFNNVNIWNNLRDYVPHPYTIEDAERFIEAQSSISPAQNLAIIHNEELAGGIGILLKEDIYRMNVELGYWVAESFWGKGIATEAVRLMTEYVFANFTINRIVAEVFEYNKSSMRVLEKNGYYLETVSRKGILKNNYLYDSYIWVKQKIY